jgi:ABC-type multidrug transport system ATPase subunit
MTKRCSSCTSEIPAAARFCDRCGADLSNAPAAFLCEWLIGNAPECDLRVESAKVSARHCRLSLRQDGYWLADLHSTNGTFVNGQRLYEALPVTPGDHITLGQGTPLPWPAKPPADFTTGARLIRIGREPDNEVVLDYPVVSGHHARLWCKTGAALLEDLGSTNGTAIGNPGRKIQCSPLQPHEQVFFGSFRVPAARLWPGRLTLGEQAHTELNFRGDTLLLGRAADCDQVLDFPMVSWHHARLTRSGMQVWVEDLGSTNGTFINGQRIQARVAVQPGDVISLGSYTFRLNATGQLEQRDYRGNLTIEARHLGVMLKGAATLLEDVSLTIYPSELVGLMGPSGAGKTTLLTALNGYLPPSQGSVLFNREDLYDNFARFSGYLGYVPQDDLLHGALTVEEALYYSARLRLPRDYSDADLQKRLTQVLAQLGLLEVRGQLIGSPEKKGISGGQRKRVNLAMELLTDPAGLFLDEPTSGLSSEDALVVLRLLRTLADAGKTILLTIHQPSLEAFRLLDNLAVIARATGPGRLTYYGPAYPDAIQFFNPAQATTPAPGLTPDAVLRGLAQAPAEEWVRRYAASAYQSQYVTARASQPLKSAGALPGSRATSRPGLAQWWTLVRRACRIKLRDAWGTAILLAQAPIIALFIVLVFGKQVDKSVSFSTTAADLPRYAEQVREFGMIAGSLKITIFLLVIAALWFGCANAAREIVGEWAIYRRERMVNLTIPAYLAAKVTVLGLLCLVQCAVLLGLVHWQCGLRAPWWQWYGILLLTALAGVGLGLGASALARTSEAALALTPIILIPMIILSGALQPRFRMSWAGPTQVMASRWAFEAALLLEAGHRERLPIYDLTQLEATAEPGEAPLPLVRSDDMAEPAFPTRADPHNGWAEDRTGLAASLGVLLVMLGLLGLALPGILKWREWRR